MRLSFRLIWLFFAISLLVLLKSAHERHLETGEKGLGLLIGPRRRLKDDVHAPYGLRLVVVDLDEDDVLLQAHRVVAPPIEALRRNTAKVANARQRRRDETIEELVHAVLAQSDLDADRPARRDLERRDRLLRPRDHRLLSGDRGQIVLGALNLLLIGGALAGADVEHDLLDP